jgi:hypothetical protein
MKEIRRTYCGLCHPRCGVCLNHTHGFARRILLICGMDGRRLGNYRAKTLSVSCSVTLAPFRYSCRAERQAIQLLPIRIVSKACQRD